MKGMFVFLLVIIVVVLCPQINASAEGDIELLHFLAMKNKVNQSRIITWQGHAMVEDYQKGFVENNDQEAFQTKSDVEFVYDVSQNAVRWNWTVVGKSELSKDGIIRRDMTERTERTFNGMKKENSFYKLYALYPDDSPMANTLAVYPRQRADGTQLDNAFDPSWFLTTFDLDIVEHLEYICRKAENEKSTPWVINRKGNRVILELVKEKGLNRFEFDLGQGGLLTRYHGKDFVAESTYEIGWRKDEHAWVPQTYSYKNVWGQRITERKTEFVDNVINAQVDSSEFSLEKIGVRAGDNIQDTHIGVLFTYGVDDIDECGVIDEDGAIEAVPTMSALPTIAFQNENVAIEDSDMVTGQVDDLNEIGPQSEGVKAVESNIPFMARFYRYHQALLIVGGLIVLTVVCLRKRFKRNFMERKSREDTSEN